MSRHFHHARFPRFPQNFQGNEAVNHVPSPPNHPEWRPGPPEERHWNPGNAGWGFPHGPYHWNPPPNMPMNRPHYNQGPGWGHPRAGGPWERPMMRPRLPPPQNPPFYPTPPRNYVKERCPPNKPPHDAGASRDRDRGFRRNQPDFIRRQSKLSEEVEDYVEQYTPEKVEENLKALQPAYVQCTQHARYYERTTENSSTVKALSSLVQLYDEFESTLACRHFKIWEPNQNVELESNCTSNIESVEGEETDVALSERVKACNKNQDSLSRQKRIQAVGIVRKLEEEARELEKPLLKYIEEDNPKVPEFALGKLKRRLERLTENMQEKENTNDEGSDEAEFDNEDYLDRAGELINSIRRLKQHEKRLHDELWYNDPGQANDGPLCRCNKAAQKKGIRHNIYPGEKTRPAWKKYFNNIGRMHNYLVTISPPVNFVTSNPTTIHYDGREYVFEGFSLLSDEPLDKLPFCDIIRFHIRYTIYLIEEPVPENFCVEGLDLFSDYFFRDILELYDWVGIGEKIASENESRKKFHFFPRFVRPLPDNGKEILSLCEVLKYLLQNNKPLVDERNLQHLMRCSHQDWLNYTDQVRGMIVTYPGMKPSSLRVDQLDRYDRQITEKSETGEESKRDNEFPLIIHFGIRPANLSYAGDPQYQRVWRSYLKLRHLMANSPKVKQSDKIKLKRREKALQEMRRAKVMQREVTVELSSRGFMRTGIFSDMCQHALLLPVLTHHIRYQLCLASLEKQIGYEFKERKWLSHAMNHPSCQMNFGSNSDHVRNALSNCGLRQPKYGDSSIHYKYTRKRGITTLIRIMARLGQKRPVLSPIEHNERLEFLGDAVVGYLTSIHLFFMFPELSEGALTTFRTVIVNNQHLAQLAERMHLDEYMLYAHGPDLCRHADLRHAMANCFEALMGAIYMEAGLEKSQQLFAKFLWDSPDLQKIWLNTPPHPLQEEEPGTDRQYIEHIPLLKRLTEFEKDINVQFTHIRLLAKAFTWRNVHENILTHGHNQRLEFLGDSICNLVTSTYLFELYPTHHEGHLTLLRATMVNGRTQSLVATELGMPKYVITNMGNGTLGNIAKPRSPDWREKNLADLLEAFVAALYIDKGLDFVRGFMQVCFFPRLKEFIITQDWNDPKSCLQQCCLTLRQEGKEPQLPTYKIENKSGPSHARKYNVAVYFKGSAIGYGHGESIQEAERNAARKALEEYNFPQLEWQRQYVARKHKVPYKSKNTLKRTRDSSKGEVESKRPCLSNLAEGK